MYIQVAKYLGIHMFSIILFYLFISNSSTTYVLYNIYKYGQSSFALVLEVIIMINRNPFERIESYHENIIYQ